MIPNDPVMLLSFINLKLRDFYPSLDDFCKSECLDKDEICKKLAQIDYTYDSTQNKFV